MSSFMYSLFNSYAGLAFCLVAGLTYVVMQLLDNSDHRIQKRISEESRSKQSFVKREKKVQHRLSQFIIKLVPSLGTKQLSSNGTDHNQLADRLRSAGYYQPQAVPIFVGMTLLLAVLPTPCALILLTFSYLTPEQAVWIALIGGGIGMLLPGLWLDRQKKRRLILLVKAIPDFLDLLITCMASGLSLEAAIKRVSDEIGHAHPLLRSELTRVQNEMNLGESVDNAMLSFAERTGCKPIKSLAVLCQQSRKYGTKISEALRAHADLLRTQRELLAEERAQKATVKILLPVLFLIFPAVFVVLAGPAAIGIWENLASPVEVTDVE
ncbi:type II secretion system F family protein [Thalassoglobus polymorphus]|uniref:Bacterial type II secretion system protein F domain protein n=1 Tax=Thalassoglobus polymorphus TaxID=2527994 RepID=A0A517QRD0_9PLAN|nr:type II secretion system F family protein [Thalassoglobus polymorphus]QDT34169.1 Bacterial type II secretion system protein F domain protein [Thalassoglobus polymorphus]